MSRKFFVFICKGAQLNFYVARTVALILHLPLRIAKSNLFQEQNVSHKFTGATRKFVTIKTFMFVHGSLILFVTRKKKQLFYTKIDLKFFFRWILHLTAKQQ